MVAPRDGREDVNQQNRTTKRGRGMFTAIRDLDDAVTLTADGRKLDAAFVPKSGYSYEHEDREGLGPRRRRYFGQNGGGGSRRDDYFNSSLNVINKEEKPAHHTFREARVSSYDTDRWNPDDADRNMPAPGKRDRDWEKTDERTGRRGAHETPPDNRRMHTGRVEKIDPPYKKEVPSTSGELERVDRQKSSDERDGKHGGDQVGERGAKGSRGEPEEGPSSWRDEDGRGPRRDSGEKRQQSTGLRSWDRGEGRDMPSNLGMDDHKQGYSHRNARFHEGRDRNWRSLERSRYEEREGSMRGHGPGSRMESRHGRWQSGPQLRRDGNSYQQPPKKVEKWGHDLFEEVVKEETTRTPEEDELKARITALLSS